MGLYPGELINGGGGLNVVVNDSLIAIIYERFLFRN